MRKELTVEEARALKDAYETATLQPPQEYFGPDQIEQVEGNIVEIIPGVAWVVKNLLSEEECDECIAAGDEFGLQAPNEKITLRTAKRTSYYMNAELSERVAAALPMEMVQTLESITPHTPVSGLHPNWP